MTMRWTCTGCGKPLPATDAAVTIHLTGPQLGGRYCSKACVMLAFDEFECRLLLLDVVRAFDAGEPQCFDFDRLPDAMACFSPAP